MEGEDRAKRPLPDLHNPAGIKGWTGEIQISSDQGEGGRARGQKPGGRKEKT